MEPFPPIAPTLLGWHLEPPSLACYFVNILETLYTLCVSETYWCSHLKGQCHFANIIKFIWVWTWRNCCNCLSARQKCLQTSLVLRCWLAKTNYNLFCWLLCVLVAAKVCLQVQQWVLGWWGGVTLALPAAAIETKLTLAVLILNYCHSHVTPWQGCSVKTVIGALGQYTNSISPKSCHARSDKEQVQIRALSAQCISTNWLWGVLFKLKPQSCPAMACTADIFWCQWPDVLWDWVELGGSAPGAHLVHSVPTGDVSAWANDSARQLLRPPGLVMDACANRCSWKTKRLCSTLKNFFNNTEAKCTFRCAALWRRRDGKGALSQHWPTVIVPGYLHHLWAEAQQQALLGELWLELLLLHGT